MQKAPDGSRIIWVKKFYLRTTTEGLPSIWWLKVNTESVIRRWLADPEGSHQINLIKHWGVAPDEQTIGYLQRVVENHVQELMPSIVETLSDQPLKPTSELRHINVTKIGPFTLSSDQRGTWKNKDLLYPIKIKSTTMTK